MRASSILEEHLAYAIPLGTSEKSSTQIDALAYSPQFEQALLSKITLFQATLDYASSQLKSDLQRRLLTRLEHHNLAMAALAYEQGHKFKLNGAERAMVASAFLTAGMRSALEMVVPDNDSNNTKNRLDIILKRLGATNGELSKYKEFLEWHDSDNLSDLLDLSYSQGIRLKAGNQARKLHYLCQLSVFTSTPKDPDDYPRSILVAPNEFFSRRIMWAIKPMLWARNALVTQSGKLIVSKAHLDNDVDFRRDLGSLADLHLKLAELIKSSHNL